LEALEWQLDDMQSRIELPEDVHEECSDSIDNSKPSRATGHSLSIRRLLWGHHRQERPSSRNRPRTTSVSSSTISTTRRTSASAVMGSSTTGRMTSNFGSFNNLQAAVVNNVNG
jgi:hypothetical protein